MMLYRIAAIAYNTYREASRARIFYGLVALALATVGYSVVIGVYTLGSALRTVSDIGAASISIYAIMTAIIIAATGLHQELANKTIFPILARPIRRGEYLVGKYLGHWITLLVFIASQGAILLMTLALMAGRNAVMVAVIIAISVGGFIGVMGKGGRLGTLLPIILAFMMFAVGVWLSWQSPDEMRVVTITCLLTSLEVAIVLSIATLFSSFSSPFLSAMLTVGLVVVGRQADSLSKLPIRIFGKWGHDAGVWTAKLVPNLYLYVPARPILTGQAATVALGSYVGVASLHAIAWAAVLLTISMLIFYKRDFL